MHNKIPPPLVTVCCVTYNHRGFISECLNGFLIQETSFNFEIVINDDASTDGTQEILKDFQKKHPGKFTVIYQKENQWSKGIKPNHIIFNAKGKYIALCEGDDYWTDPLKLQKQVDFLEANEDFSICFHPVEILENGEIYTDDLEKVADETTILDLAKGNYIHTPSVVFRNHNESWNNEIIDKSPVGDYVIHMLNARYGKIKKLTQTMAVYRRGVGMWSTKKKSQRVKSTLRTINLLIGEFKDNLLVKEELKRQQKKFRKVKKSKNRIFILVAHLKDFISNRLARKKNT